MEWKNRAKFFQNSEVFLLSTLIAVHQVNLIRVLDFLRYIQNIVEALVVPIVSLCLGLLLPKLLKLKPNLVVLSVLLFSFVFAISFRNYWITMSVVGFFYFFAGQALKIYSIGLGPVEFYAKELLGWIIGSLFAYVTLPWLGAEKIFLITVFGFLCFFFWTITSRVLLAFPIFVTGVLVTIFLSNEQFNLYNVVRFIPSKRSYLNETKYNGSYSVQVLGAKILDTIWTPYDRIDVMEFPDGERSIFFSNQAWSRFPSSGVEKDLVGMNENSSKKALILGLGGGIEFSFLERAGFRKIVGVEHYNELIRLMSNRYSPNLFSRNIPVAGDMRHFLRTTDSRFDFILHSSPDLATRIGFSGWPIVNESTTFESFQSAFQRLNENGLLTVRSYYKRGNNFSLGILHSLRNLSPEHRVQIYFLSQEMHDTPKTHHLFVIKKGRYESSDHKLIQAIYPDSIRIKDSSVGDPEFFTEVQETLKFDVSDLSLVGRDTLLEKIKFDRELFIWWLLVVLAGISIGSFGMRALLTNGDFFGLVFFSGFYWAILEFSLITYFSNTFSDSILAFLLVFQGLMFGSWVSNFYLPDKIPKGNLLSFLSPFLATAVFSIVLIGLERWNPQPSVWFVFLFVFVVGVFGSFNFNFAIRKITGVPSLLAWNLIGFTVGAIASWFLVKEGKPDLFINLLLASSLYGVTGLFLRSRTG